ncbi:GNAT family N-acetyltransferase [Geobacillus sp. NFOSA3]|uniref:Ribosomal protein S18 acetylase RimI-like enzyme n=3 Tax=Parageobacillus TaxID=1906945 RepID=A0A6G9J2H3_9BACL|nr:MULTISPECIES: GNAT family N-acetyltransferase [Parageobacillus]NNU93105.1 GNAT family N-acetyltransferase [Geobacillus sp. NFOSA3]OQP00601.1 N-acetyltransferase [Geobacillus sp. 44C]MBB3868090.1 ribosomal protein S18 acetylase RimI-like enzyme [Parageobacillus toebii NBRC 107807]MED4968782.1 GNAT family N-acetyltransferase [Parageobacillus toebii]MED4988465.1 GNAT family N-acetyltransferase [Parageobacillus toebii]
MYRKELYVFNGDVPQKAIIRNYTKNDFSQLIRVQQESFPPPFPSELWWNEEQLTNHVSLFPEGALCVEVDGRVVGSMTGLLVHFDPRHPSHTWEEITDGGYIRNHRPDGNTLYVVDICVSPNYRKLGLGKWLMQSMYEVVVRLNVDRLLGGGRMPGYHRHADRLSATQYLEKVLKGELKDPVITFLLRCGRTPLQVIENYLEDEESLNYAVLMEWRNPFKHHG